MQVPPWCQPSSESSDNPRNICCSWVSSQPLSGEKLNNAGTTLVPTLLGPNPKSICCSWVSGHSGSEATSRVEKSWTNMNIEHWTMEITLSDHYAGATLVPTLLRPNPKSICCSWVSGHTGSVANRNRNANLKKQNKYNQWRQRFPTIMQVPPWCQPSSDPTLKVSSWVSSHTGSVATCTVVKSRTNVNNGDNVIRPLCRC